MKAADIRREKLARYIAQGIPLTVAARKAGFVGVDYARKILTESGVAERVHEIIAEGYEQTLRDSAALDAKLESMLDADPRLFFDEDGRVLHPHNMRNEEAMILTGIKQGAYGVELKFESPLAVLKTAMQRRGMLVDRKEMRIESTDDIADSMSAQDAAEIYKLML